MSWKENDALDRGGKAKNLLIGANAFYENDHVVLTSGMHSDAYVNHDPLFTGRNTPQLSELAGFLAEMIIYELKLDAIPGALVGPMTGGFHLAHWTGHHYRLLKDSAPSLAAEKGEKGAFYFTPYDAKLIEGKKVLMIDDVLTTGGSARATLEAIKKAGGDCYGLLVVCDRSGKSAEELGLPAVWSLFTLAAKKWTAEECPLCKAGKRVNTQVGHGTEFVMKRITPPPT